MASTSKTLMTLLTAKAHWRLKIASNRSPSLRFSSTTFFNWHCIRRTTSIHMAPELCNSTSNQRTTLCSSTSASKKSCRSPRSSGRVPMKNRFASTSTSRMSGMDTFTSSMNILIVCKGWLLKCWRRLRPWRTSSLVFKKSNKSSPTTNSKLSSKTSLKSYKNSVMRFSNLTILTTKSSKE